MKEVEKWKAFLSESKLRVFDFDDTLVKTDATVGITYEDGTSNRLTPAEFSVHKMDEKNKYDFSEFNHVLNPKEIKKVTNILRNMLGAAGSRDIVILTARDTESQITYTPKVCSLVCC